ncbi:MAG: hypothetical protein K1X66_08695 [Verrucomicrobiae bacterium]|nr:hypothetical protein [Verrucomicrobiae bacterium]
MAMVNDLEKRSFALLYDMHVELNNAINSLGKKESNGLKDAFYFFNASYLNKITEGYISLRESRKFEASQQLIRLCLEMMFKLRAVLNKPELLFRIAYTERLEDSKLLRPIAIRKGDDYDANEKKEWDQFKSNYKELFPEHNLEEKELKIWEMAKIAGILPYYETYYRFYCQTTHAVFRAATGDLKCFEKEDNGVMASCVLSALQVLISLGLVLDLEPLIDCLSKLDENT